MDISVHTEARQVEDHSWLGSAHGLSATRTVTLDISTAFVKATHYPNGFIPSGIALGKITATGLYAPYDDTANDGRQTAAGYLAFTVQVPNVDDTTKDAGAALMEHGAVIESKLPFSGATVGAIDAAGKVDLAGRIVHR